MQSILGDLELSNPIYPRAFRRSYVMLRGNPEYNITRLFPVSSVFHKRLQVRIAVRREVLERNRMIWSRIWSNWKDEPLARRRRFVHLYLLIDVSGCEFK